MRLCPVCKDVAVEWARCPKSDSVCSQGHKWHYCLAHKGNLKSVLGWDYIVGQVNECSCLKEEEKTMNKVPVCPNCQAENMPDNEALNKALALGEGEQECSTCSAIYNYKVELGLIFTQ